MTDRPLPGPPLPGPPLAGPPLPLLDLAEQRLAALAGLAPAEQVAGYDEVHRLLQDALQAASAALDEPRG